MLLGANSNWYADMQSAVPAATGRRVFYPEINFIPETWPVITGSTAVVSIRPNPDDLLAGRLDAAISQFVHSAKNVQFLNAWHEAGNLPEYDSMSFINPQNMIKVHKYMHELCKHSNVRYGPVMCMPPDSMPPWMPGGMDWYGLDIYDWSEFHFPNGGPLDIHGRLYPRLNQWRQVCTQVSGKRLPALRICETNSQFSSHRPKWFTAVGNWIKNNGDYQMLTFWSSAPGAVGPWLPDDHDTIEALSNLA